MSADATPASGDDRDRAAAADRLMQALEDWAASLGDAGVQRADGARYFPARQMHRGMRKAHQEGRLFESLTDWLPDWRYRANAFTERMKDIVRHDAPLWEDIVAKEDEPWSAYITPEQRAHLRRISDRIRADVQRGDRLVEQLRREQSERDRP